MQQADEGERVAELLRHEHSLGTGVRRFQVGSVPVFAAGERYVVKLFPPKQRAYFDTERAALAFLDGRLPFQTPRIVDAGERDDWLYIVMTRLPGGALSELWTEIEHKDRTRLMSEAGRALRALHATATQGPPLKPLDWSAFIGEQRASATERQRAKGLAGPWVNAIGDFLARWTPDSDGPCALLHTEVMRDHVLVEHRNGVWHLSGFIDFEDVLLGAAEYEFAPAGLFLSCAEPGLLRGLLEGYGAEADDELPFRLMAYALLHRYSNLPWYLKRLPFQGEAGNLEALARAWFTP